MALMCNMATPRLKSNFPLSSCALNIELFLGSGICASAWTGQADPRYQESLISGASTSDLLTPKHYPGNTPVAAVVAHATVFRDVVTEQSSQQKKKQQEEDRLERERLKALKVCICNSQRSILTFS